MSGDIVIVGDGWAAWSTAAGLARAVRRSRTITVVPVAAADPLAIATDGDAALWFGLLGLDPAAAFAEADATFRLGTAVTDGARQGFVPIADRAPQAGGIPFDLLGLGPRAMVDPLECVARAGRMIAPPQDHAFHLALAPYTALLRRRAAIDGVVRAPAALASIERDADGDVISLTMADGRRIDADLFVDATDRSSSMRLASPDRHGRDGPVLARIATDDDVAVTPTGPAMTSVTIAKDAGWSTRLPLRNRTVTVDCRIRPGEQRRLARAWHGNVVAIGTRYGMLEGAEGGDWALVQKGVTQLVQLLPPDRPTDALRAEYNSRLAALHDQWAMAAAIRHRRACRDTAAPDGRTALYAATGRLPASDDLAIPDVAWRALFAVHDIAHPRMHPLAPRAAIALLPPWRAALAELVARCPPHAALLDRIDPR